MLTKWWLEYFSWPCFVWNPVTRFRQKANRMCSAWPNGYNFHRFCFRDTEVHNCSVTLLFSVTCVQHHAVNVRSYPNHHCTAPKLLLSLLQNFEWCIQLAIIVQPLNLGCPCCKISNGVYNLLKASETNHWSGFKEWRRVDKYSRTFIVFNTCTPFAYDSISNECFALSFDRLPGQWPPRVDEFRHGMLDYYSLRLEI
jgi:hypothetical protein